MKILICKIKFDYYLNPYLSISLIVMFNLTLADPRLFTRVTFMTIIKTQYHFIELGKFTFSALSFTHKFGIQKLRESSSYP
jgi:hypothetical protein